MSDRSITNCTSCVLCREQKWSKGKVRDKLNNLVLFDKATYDKLYKEVPNYKLITPAVVSERLKIRGSLARNALQELLAKGERLTTILVPVLKLQEAALKWVLGICQWKTFRFWCPSHAWFCLASPE